MLSDVELICSMQNKVLKAKNVDCTKSVSFKLSTTIADYIFVVSWNEI